MANETTGNVDDNRSLDTRRWKEQDNDGHLPGSRQQGSNQEISEELRKQDDQDTRGLNKLDDRETPSGTETV